MFQNPVERPGVSVGNPVEKMSTGEIKRAFRYSESGRSIFAHIIGVSVKEITRK